MKGVLARVSAADIGKAIALAQQRAVAFEDLSGPKEKAYGQIEGILKRQLALADDFQREVFNFRAAVPREPGGRQRGPAPGRASRRC
jgi:hypothetical protein